jgi:hypothetical protein
MGKNLITAYIGVSYSLSEGEKITKWISERKDRQEFFSQFQKQFADQSDGGPTFVASLGAPPPLKKETAADILNSGTFLGRSEAQSEILEPRVTRKVSYKERKEREMKAVGEMKMRLRRLRSDDSIRSVETAIYNPLPTPPALSAEHLKGQSWALDGSKEKMNRMTGAVSSFFSTAVDGTMLAKALQRAQKRGTIA